MSVISRPTWAVTSVLTLCLTAWLSVTSGAGTAAAAPAAARVSASASAKPSTPAAASPSPSATPTPAPPLPPNALSTPAPTPSTAPVSATPPTGKADDGSFVQSESWLDPRMADIQIGSIAVGAVVPARIIVPAGWSADSDGETWPVLYLLHGGNDDYTSWTRVTDIESFVADKNVIVVMPENGPTGIPTRWWNGGKNKPDYETFDAVELMQILQRDFNASSTRAVAGVSTGAYGAIMMAAHYPQTFTAAASYSGILNTTYPGMPAVMRELVSRAGIQPDALWGDPTHNPGLWTQNNPYAQATNLRWTSLFVSCSDGGGQIRDVIGQTLEHAIEPQNIAFADRLKVLGIPAQTYFPTDSAHNWIAWRVAFGVSWPMLAAALGLPS
jgi:diacylglycerol O-acyltransferase / trehalose O-mycolyltransferase